MAWSEVYEFGEFVLEPAERRLSRRDRPVPLAPKAYDLLAALVRHAGRLVTKRELLEYVWPDTFVEEGILAVRVSALRRVLGDGNRNPDYIETIPRAGYRFTAHVTHRLARGEPVTLGDPLGHVTTEPMVYELVGRGRAHLLTASSAEIPKAIAAFRSALEIDATYAAAHAGLALAWCAQAELRLSPPADAYREARTSALRALAMQPSCADAQVALGTVLFLSDWNWAAARRSLERALEIDPDNTEAYLLYGRLLEALGDLAGGLAVKQRALARDPFSARVHLQIALSHWNARRYDDTIEWARRALKLDPLHLLARDYIAAAYLKKGDIDRHVAESLEHAAPCDIPVDVLADLARACDRGRRGIVQYALTHTPESAPPLQLALLHAEAGHTDDAFRFLDKALDWHDPCLVDLAVAPQWDDLRADPRFDERLARMGLRRLKGVAAAS